MKKFKFNPSKSGCCDDYSDMECIAPGVFRTVYTLKDYIEGISNDKLIKVMQEYNEYKSLGKSSNIELLSVISTKYYKYLPNESDEIVYLAIYNLVCEKIAFTWANVLMDND